MRKILLGAALTAAAVLAVAPASSAEPIDAGTASSFGASVNITDQGVIPPTPEASVEAPPFEDDAAETTVPIDAAPLAVNGTLIANAAVHEQSDIESSLEQPASQHELAGPYNAAAVGQIEDLEVLVDAVAADVPVLEADLVRAEAVAVCTDGQVEYAASSEVVNLVIAGEDPLSEALNDLITQITDGIEPLAPILDVDLNVVEETADGISVDAIVVSVLAAAGEDPLVTLRLGHAEVGGVTCDDGGDEGPECSNGIDDDGDGLIDEADPDCHTDGDPNDGDDSYNPDDDNESPTECNDDIDNDGNDDIDEADPECHTDGDATNPDSYDANIESEGARVQDTGAGQLPSSAGGDALPRTGAPIATGAAAALGAGALALMALRRRMAA